MAVVGADLPLHKRVSLIQQETGRKADAEVVWRSHEAWDAGFELVEPDATFWGIAVTAKHPADSNYCGHFSFGKLF